MKIVINGCFDLLHKGHKKLINTALKYSDSGKVLLLMNSDKSIAALKGDRRPLEHISLRSENIQKVIDDYQRKTMEYPRLSVRIFDTEKELAEIIDEFEPDMIIKGDDRPDVREIIGYGKWPILFIPTVRDKKGKKISTTEIAKERGLL